MSETTPPLDPDLCRSRQKKLRTYLSENNFDAAVFFDRHYVYGLSGYWHEQPLTRTAIIVETDGDTIIASHDEEPVAPAADKIASYIPNHLFTLKENLSECVTGVLNPFLKKHKVVATEQQTPAALIDGPECRDISTDYQYLRRHKDADEVAALEFTIGCADRAYTEALQMLDPGVGEVELMAAMLEEATFAAGEILSGWGQDFKSGVPGGFARPNHPMEAGDLI